MDDIVLLSTADWDHPFWTNKQHMAVQLAARGHRVFYVESLGLRRPSVGPADLARILRRLRKGLRPPRRVRENLWVFSPLVIPWQRYGAIRRLNRLLLDATLSFWLRRLGLRKDVLWSYNPLTLALMDAEACGRLVYHCVDDIKAQPGMPRAVLEAGERALVQRADVVFVTSPWLLEAHRPANPRTYYFPNVADYDHFSVAMAPGTAVPEDLARIPAPRLGFIGAISGYKLDFDLLRSVAEAHPEWSLVLIGQVGEGDPWTDPARLAGLPNLHLLGSRPYSTLPAYLKGMDVALLPNRLNDYTQAMFPMKFFEYLAAGRPVVSTNLAALQDFREVVWLAQSPAEFAEGIARALRGEAPPLEARLALARQHTYAARLEKMMAVLEGGAPEPEIPGP